MDIDRLSRGARDAPTAPGPEPDHCTEQQRSLLATFSGDEDALTGREIHVILAEADGARRRSDLQIIEADRGALALLEIDPARALPEAVHGDQRAAEAAPG